MPCMLPLYTVMLSHAHIRFFFQVVVICCLFISLKYPSSVLIYFSTNLPPTRMFHIFLFVAHILHSRHVFVKVLTSAVPMELLRTHERSLYKSQPFSICSLPPSSLLFSRCVYLAAYTIASSTSNLVWSFC